MILVFHLHCFESLIFLLSLSNLQLYLVQRITDACELKFD